MKRLGFASLLLAVLLLAFAIAFGCGSRWSGSTEMADDDDNDDASPATTLYAAAGHAIITPTKANHPEQIYLGGIIPSRVCTGVHDDLFATAVAMKQGNTQAILVELDFVGFTRTRIREIQERLAAHGFTKENIIIASTHTHEGPDTLGVYGPNLLTSGVSPEFIAFVQDSVVNLVLDVWTRLEPVTMKAGKIDMNDPLSNYPNLIKDQRLPFVSTTFITAAQFIGLDGHTVATIVNWANHPEVMIKSTLVSSDFPGYLRRHVSEKLGGETLYMSGALGGLSSPTGASVPARDEFDRPIYDAQGQPVYYLDGTWDKARSLGFVVGDKAIEALATAPVTDAAPQLEIDVQELLLPVTTPTFVLGFLIHLLQYSSEDVYTGNPAFCGPIGCSKDRLALLRFGPVELLTSPGETFPETYVGRGASSYDYGAPWGVSNFPAKIGLITYMDAPIPMYMGLSNNEIAYLVPASDWAPYGHPAHYEEDECFSKETEQLYHDAAKALLLAHQKKQP